MPFHVFSMMATCKQAASLYSLQEFAESGHEYKAGRFDHSSTYSSTKVVLYLYLVTVISTSEANVPHHDNNALQVREKGAVETAMYSAVFRHSNHSSIRIV